MANWWDSAPLAEKPVGTAQSGNWWDAAPVVKSGKHLSFEEGKALLDKEALAKQAYTGSVLPLSRDEEGAVSFDSNAGLLGSIKRAIMLPGDAYSGKVDPMSQEGRDRAMEFAATFSPINPAVRAGETVIPGVANALRKAEVNPPSVDELKAASSAGYDAMRSSGVDYKASSVEELAKRLKTELETDGILSELAPKAHGVLNKLSSAPEGSVASISGLEAARRAFGHAGKDFANPTDQLAAERSVRGLDEFIRGAGDDAVAAGDPKAAASLLDEARGNYAAAKRSEKLDGVEYAAQLRANAANSGQNIGNSTRQRIASLLLNPKARAGYNADEIAALEGVDTGSKAANATRYIGNLLGGGGGLGAATTGFMGAAAGGMSGSPGLAVAGAALPIAGAITKKVSNSLTEKALREVSQQTRKRSPLFEEMMRNAPSEAALPNNTEALIRAYLLGQYGSQANQ